MHDDEFEPRLGRMARRGSEPRYLSKVMKAARRAGKRTGRTGRFDGSRIGRGASIGRVLRSGDRHTAFRSRRVIVKMRPVLLSGKGVGGARAHLRYIQRDGVTREGQPGELYSADKDVADGKGFLEQSSGDLHQFRFIVSIEDADQYQDLKPFVRRLMSQMEVDLGTKLDWVAVDHFNTGHPHTHVILRGKDDRGDNLVIAREYISHGLRERAAQIVTLDLGPRTDLEIEQRLRREMGEERLTTIDRRLIRDMDALEAVRVSDADSFQQSLRIGRLRKLAKMGLAEHLGGDTWRLEPDLADTLRRVGERGDIIRTMQRELAARNLDRPAADHVIYRPGAPDAMSLVGRVITRGLADEVQDRHYVMVDGTDGRTHYINIGKGMATDPIPENAIVRITPRSGGIRSADRTIAEVAVANGGLYTVDAHLRHDPAATQDFAETHVRRLEAMRRVARNVEREPDGAWIVTANHLDKVSAFEDRLTRNQPVTVETLATVPLHRLVSVEAATWLDRELVADTPVPLRDAGFGREVRGALAMRQQWLVAAELAEEHGSETVVRPDTLAILRRRELLRVAGQFSDELGLPFAETKNGDWVEGRLAQVVDMHSGRHALIERSHEFTLVPWRPVLERQLGRSVQGIMRADGINWTLGRQRKGPTIS